MLSHIATTAAVKRANRLQVVEPLCEEPQSACHQLTMQKQVARMQRNVVRTATRKCRRLEPIISCVCTVTALSLCFAQIEYSNVTKKEKSKPVSLNDLDVSENCKAFLYSRFGHRTLTFCGECANREVIPFIDVVNSTEPTDAEPDVTYSIEAHFDRSYGSGQAFDSRGHFHD